MKQGSDNQYPPRPPRIMARSRHPVPRRGRNDGFARLLYCYNTSERYDHERLH